MSAAAGGSSIADRTDRGPSWGETTAIFGGTFDPPHVGHREALNGLFREPGIGRALVLPAASPPHKPTVARAADRLALTELCFARGKLLGPAEISTLELDRAGDRPSYSFDTLIELGSKIRKLAFVIGADQCAAMQGEDGRPGWYRFPEILSLSDWIIVARKPDGASVIARTLGQWGDLLTPVDSSHWKTRSGNRLLRVVETPARAISSTQIREAISTQGVAPEGSLDPEVEAYLKHHGIYGIG